MKTKFQKIWILFLVSFFVSLSAFGRGCELEVIPAARLPIEAQHTLVLIKQGGPFPYSKDGAVFGNYEGVLPKQKRGYYHEYTVKTAGVRHRGARRIVAGGKPPAPREYYYTEDHYTTFKRIKE